ncbi:hypothetical protein ACPW96_21775 [Micromonospora sp. DT81.3]
MTPTRLGSAWPGVDGSEGARGGRGAVEVQRPVGDRVKTDMRDGVYLTRLLRLSEAVEVTVPSIEAESLGIWSGRGRTRAGI